MSWPWKEPVHTSAHLTASHRKSNFLSICAMLMIFLSPDPSESFNRWGLDTRPLLMRVIWGREIGLPLVTVREICSDICGLKWWPKTHQTETACELRASCSHFYLLGYVHTGPVPNGSDPILERTISVHTAPFRLSTSGHTGPIRYGSVLNRSKKSSCFYQLSMRSTINSTSAQA